MKFKTKNGNTVTTTKNQVSLCQGDSLYQIVVQGHVFLVTKEEFTKVESELKEDKEEIKGKKK